MSQGPGLHHQRQASQRSRLLMARNNTGVLSAIVGLRVMALMVIRPRNSCKPSEVSPRPTWHLLISICTRLRSSSLDHQTRGSCGLQLAAEDSLGLFFILRENFGFFFQRGGRKFIRPPDLLSPTPNLMLLRHISVANPKFCVGDPLFEV